MDVTTVEQAVSTLRQQGTPVSVRQVHRLTGGSLRDVSRILRALQPSLLPSPHGAAETASGHVALTVPQPVAEALDGLQEALQKDGHLRTDLLLWARRLERGSSNKLGPLSGLIAALAGGVGE